MANFFSFLFGSKYPATAKFEAELNELYADRDHFKEYEQSLVYQKYLTLDKTVNSGEFEKAVIKLKTERFKDTEAYNKLKKYNTLKSSKDIKAYLHFVESGKAKKLDSIVSSPNYLQMKELEMTTSLASFKEKMHSKDFKQSSEYQELQSFKNLQHQTDNAFAIKTLKSSEYLTYDTVKDSPRLQEYLELDKYINSDNYNKFYAFMHDKDRFKKSEEAKVLHEYNEIKNSNDFKRFVKLKNNYPFTEIDKWELAFEDDFDKQKLDTNKWMTGYYWGKALLNDNYVLKGEKQFFTDKNVETKDSHLRISTRKEACSGKVWDATMGFCPSKFDYTSGLISTGHSFRQAYGKIDIKFKLKEGKDINHAFWLLGEKNIPQITILKTGGKNHSQFEVGTASGVDQKPIIKPQTLTGPNLTNDYRIISLEWTPNNLKWFINGVKVGEQTGNVPSENMYLILSTHITNTIDEKQLPASIEIDWVKWYKAL